MPVSNTTFSQEPNTQAYVCIGLGVLLGLAGLFFLGGTRTQSQASPSYGYNYSAGGNFGSLFSLPQLLMLSLAITLVIVGIVSLRRDS